MYQKAGMNEKAIEVLLENDQNIERAIEFAERIGSPEVWSKLAEAQLRSGSIN